MMIEFRAWIEKYRKKDYELLLRIVKKECYPWIKDVLDLYYCLSKIYRQNKNINIPLSWELAEIVYEDLREKEG